MSKQALLQREIKRDKLVAKFAKKHAELKKTSNDFKRTDDECKALLTAFRFPFKN